MNRAAYWIATLGGAGLSPKAPGTVGSLIGMALFLAAAPLGAAAQAGGLFLLLLVGWWAAQRCGKVWGSHDDPRIVIDEAAGMWLTLTGLPVSLFNCLAGFALFRLFDILKPFPIRWIERKIPGAAGVIADDLAAAIFARAILYVGLQLWGPA